MGPGWFRGISSCVAEVFQERRPQLYFFELWVFLTENSCTDFCSCLSVTSRGILTLEDNLGIQHSTLVLSVPVIQEAFEPVMLIAVEADCNIPPCNPFLILWFQSESFYTKLSWLVGKNGKKTRRRNSSLDISTFICPFAFWPSSLIQSGSIPQPRDRQILSRPSHLDAWWASFISSSRNPSTCWLHEGLSLGCWSVVGWWLVGDPLSGPHWGSGAWYLASGWFVHPHCTSVLGSSPLGSSSCSFLWQHTLCRMG